MRWILVLAALISFALLQSRQTATASTWPQAIPGATEPVAGGIDDGTIPPLPTGTIPQPQVFITEFMADNENTLKDEDDDSSDWIEIHNGGTVAVNLSGWALTDKADDLLHWRFPVVMLAPGEYLVVFASDKNRALPDQQLHTNFKLRGEGEYLALSTPDAVVVSSFAPAFPAQYPDISYGIDAGGTQRYFAAPTPGGDNNLPTNAGPLIHDVSYAPAALYPGQPLTVRAVVSAGAEGVGHVDLHYRILFEPEVRLPMALEGSDADGRLVYRAEIPAAAYTVGDMVRFYTLAYDNLERTTRWPLFASALNSPRYAGTMVLDSTIRTKDPVLYWFVQDVAGAGTDEGTRSVVFYDSLLYDNVLVHVRGSTSANAEKKSYKFVFNDGYHLRLAPYDIYVDEINVNANFADNSYLRQVIAWESFRDAGSPYSLAFPLRLQRNKEFFGLYTFVEQPDRRYFERQNIDWDGALYKVFFNDLTSNVQGVEKRTRTAEDASDLRALVDGLRLRGDERAAYLFDNINIPAVINYLAVNNIIQEWDLAHKNYYLYRDTEKTGEWMFIAWDKDLSFGGVGANDVNSHPFHGSREHPAVYVESGVQFWNRLIDVIYTTPATREMYLRRLRTLMDQLLQSPDTPANARYYETRIRELTTQITDDAALDEELWQPLHDLVSALATLQDDGLDAKRGQLYGSFAAENGGMIPAAQPESANIDFGLIDNQALGEDENAEFFVLKNPGSYAVDLSGWTVNGDINYTFRAGVVIPARSELYVAKNVRQFRERVQSPRGGERLFVQGGYKGQLSDQLGSLLLKNRNGALIDRVAFWRNGETLPGDVYLPLIVKQ